MEHLSRIVLRNSVFGLAAQVAIKVVSFAFSVVIVRHLGAHAYGQYAAVLAFGAVFVFFADLGLATYSVREVAHRRDQPAGREQINELFRDVLGLRLVLSVVTAGLLITVAWLTGRPLVMVGAIALGTIGLIMYSVQGTCDAVLAGFERLDVSAGAKVFSQVAFVLVGASALWLGLGYYGLIAANLVGVALMTYVCWRAVDRLQVRPGRLTVRSWPKLLTASWPFGIIGFALGLSYNFDSVLLNVFRGDAETGYYTAAYNLVFSAAVLSGVINTSLYPSLARQAANAPDQLPRVYDRVLRYLMTISLPIAVGGWILAGQIIPLLFTSSYAPAIPVLELVAWVVPLMFGSEFLGYIVLVRGEERQAARAILVSSGVNVLFNSLLVPRFGVTAAAAMTVLTEAILVGQYVWMLRSTIRQLNLVHILGRPLVAALTMGLIVSLVRHELPLLLTLVLATVVYGGLVLALGIIGKDEVHFVYSLRQRTRASSPTVALPPTR